MVEYEGETDKGVSSMANIFDVAKYIVDTVGGDVSAMKLQKLCYYCQAWCLVWDGKPLFKEEFRHWDNGPVCRELYDFHKGMFTVDEIPDSYLSGYEFSDTEIEHMEQVIEDYGKYSGGQLSELSHSEAPWKNTKKNEVITKDSMDAYYGNLDKAELFDDPYFKSPQFLADVEKILAETANEEKIDLGEVKSGKEIFEKLGIA